MQNKLSFQSKVGFLCQFCLKTAPGVCRRGVVFLRAQAFSPVLPRARCTSWMTKWTSEPRTWTAPYQIAIHGGRSQQRRRRAEAAGAMVEPVRYQGARRAQPQGHPLRIRRGQHRQQERSPPRVQPRAQEGARAPPRRQARLRVPDHRGVRRRGLPGRRPPPPPRRPLPPRPRSLLGLLRRRQAVQHLDTRLQRPDVGGQGGGGEAGRGRAGEVGGGVPGVLRRRGVLRRGRRWARGRRTRWLPRLAARVRGDVRRQGHRPRQDAAAGGLGGPLRRAPRRRGGDPRRAQAAGVQQDEAGSPWPAIGAGPLGQLPCCV
ncbi:hypothetical protein BS78_01G306100 [Paspalum vaginatum]|nr:hypothetical protein BS78_01G306100 [Paspalum vaginatum]